MDAMIEAYPLYWPAEYPRIKTKKDSRFKTTLAVARDFVKVEAKRLGATGLIISSNVPVKQNGDMYADWQRYKIEDFGVAVYFNTNGNQVCLCCDTYSKVYDNLHAIGRTIEALRQIDRDGVSDFLNRSFKGFTALPQSNIWSEFGLNGKPETLSELETAYKIAAKKTHPDTGGSVEAFQKLQQAYEQVNKLF